MWQYFIEVQDLVLIGIFTMPDRQGSWHGHRKGEVAMSKNQTHSIRMTPYKIQSVSLHDLVSDSELIEFLRVRSPYSEAYGRIPVCESSVCI